MLVFNAGDANEDLKALFPDTFPGLCHSFHDPQNMIFFKKNLIKTSFLNFRFGWIINLTVIYLRNFILQTFYQKLTKCTSSWHPAGFIGKLNKSI